jgi:sortase (surface protein transpeptidase)
MNSATRRGGRRGTVRAAAATVALFLVGVLALVLGIRGSDGPPQPVAVAAAPSSTSTSDIGAEPTTSPSPGTKPSLGPVAETSTPAKKKVSQPRLGRLLPASDPVALEIPSIGVKSSNFVDLQVAENGTLDVPGSADEVGFYTGGPTPGQFGPAVLGAHVDSTEGPGIFYHLGAVKPGAKIHIARKDKSRVTFVVDKVEVHPKDDFPTEAVYRGRFDRAEIRLVTCGGTFDRKKHYLDNVVVFGHLAP